MKIFLWLVAEDDTGRSQSFKAYRGVEPIHYGWLGRCREPCTKVCGQLLGAESGPQLTASEETGNSTL